MTSLDWTLELISLLIIILCDYFSFMKKLYFKLFIYLNKKIIGKTIN